MIKLTSDMNSLTIINPGYKILAEPGDRTSNLPTGFIPLSQMSIVSILIMWESSQWLGKNIVLSIG